MQEGNECLKQQRKMKRAMMNHQHMMQSSSISPHEMVTIDDINIVTEMNTSQMAVHQQEQPSHNYNLREQPTEQKERISLVQTDMDHKLVQVGQYTTIHPKPHADAKERERRAKCIWRQGRPSNYEGTKAITQKNAFLLMKKEDISFDNHKRAIGYLMFLKYKRDGEIKARSCTNSIPQQEYYKR